ncbi:hypothetical protein I4U23_014709 [Adineta vaga]|nr:hypothetical protein I4U23_014709 [Adineta vaga]
MSGGILVLLLPIFFIFSLIINQQSNELEDVIPHRWKYNIPIQVNNRVNVEFFVMSKCPDAKKCEISFSPSLLKLSSIINFTLSFIALESETNHFECMHGIDECIGNRQQLCIQNMYSTSVFIQYLRCQAKEFYTIPRNGERCANETSKNIINWSDVERCVTSERSNDLFHRSLERTRLALAKKSCTIHLNGVFWCMHDGYWNDCKEGYDEKSFIKAICSRYNGTNKPIECRNIDSN